MEDPTYGEQGLTAREVLESVPEFPKAGRRERNYNADIVDEYIDSVLSVLKKEYEERKIAQDALNATKKRLDASETEVDRLNLMIQSNGEYDPTSEQSTLAPFDPDAKKADETFDADQWSSGLSENKTHTEELENRIEELEQESETLRIKLAKAENKEKLFKSKPVEEEEDTLWDEVEEEEPVVEEVEIPRAEPKYQYVNENTGRVNLSDIEKSQLILVEASKIAESHVASANASARKIISDAHQESQKFVSDERRKLEEAEINLERATEQLHAIVKTHLNQAQGLGAFLQEVEQNGVHHFVEDDSSGVEQWDVPQGNNTVVKPRSDWEGTVDNFSFDKLDKYPND